LTNAVATATTLAGALRTGVISVREAVAAHLERIDGAAGYRAVVSHRDLDELADEIDAAQGRLDEGDEAPLVGVPFTVKDIIAVAGLPLTAGSRLLADHRARVDASVVARLRAAGAIPIAKTNCPEFAFGIGTANDLHGATLSPWGTDRSPGGSSGGEAVAVALGLSAFGIGTDFGGSVRWPAQSLGVLGLRPTPGRVPRTGQLVGVGPTGIDGRAVLAPASLQGLVQTPGLLARSVDDLEMVLRVAAGPDPRDILAAPVLLSAEAVDLGAIDIAVCDGRCIGAVRDDVVAAVEDLGRDLQAEGLRVRFVSSLFEGARASYDRLRSYDDLSDLRRLVEGRGKDLTAGLRAILEAAAPPVEGRSEAWERAIGARAAGLSELATTPLVVLPVASGPATGHDETMQVGDRLLRGFDVMALCRAVSLLGVPALSIPISRSTEGLPLSVQVLGPPWAEHLVLALGRRIEQLRGGWQPPPAANTHETNQEE